MTLEEKLQKANILIDKYIEMLGRNCQTCRFGAKLICYCGERIKTKERCDKTNNYKYYERDNIDG